VKTIAQRVSSARVIVEGETVGAIERGLVAFVGVEKGDGEADAALTARKLAELRLFPGRTPMDHDVREVDGAVLVISQFTLLASIRKGRRPSFDAAEQPELARALYERVCALLVELGVRVQTGCFGAYMQVHAIGEGPVTIPIVTHRGALI
jgi:D-aminoacyl-tRNA deacylase